MKFFRFMGADECFRLCLHHRLLQQVDWHEMGYKSTSKGFTFGVGDVEDAVKASRWLKGVVTMQYLLVADVADDVADARFKHCQGGYPDYRKDDPTTDTRYVDEVYTTNYSLEDFRDYDFYVCLGISDKSQLVLVHYENTKTITSLLLANNIADHQRFSNINMKGLSPKYVRNDLTEYRSIYDGFAKFFVERDNMADKYSK